MPRIVHGLAEGKGRPLPLIDQRLLADLGAHEHRVGGRGGDGVATQDAGPARVRRATSAQRGAGPPHHTGDPSPAALNNLRLLIR